MKVVYKKVFANKSEFVYIGFIRSTRSNGTKVVYNEVGEVYSWLDGFGYLHYDADDGAIGFETFEAAEAALMVAEEQWIREMDRIQELEEELEDDGMTDVEADTDTLRNIGWGTDEDYGYYGDDAEY